jgi:hypothetical protein
MADTVKIKRRTRTPARTPVEISSRLYTLSRTLERKVEKGETLDIEQTLLLARRLKAYAARLRRGPTQFSIY